MYSYEKRLQYPVNIKCRNPKIAQVIILSMVEDIAITYNGFYIEESGDFL